jgi:hypothetical protein
MSQPSFDPMSQPSGDVSSAPSSTVKRPLDLYTLMILIAFGAMLAGTILLFVELGRWGSFSELPWNTDSATPNLQAGSSP